MTNTFRRVCVVSERGKQGSDYRIYSSVKKAYESLSLAIAYNTFRTYLFRSKQKSGVQKIEIEDKEGVSYIVEVKRLY